MWLMIDYYSCRSGLGLVSEVDICEGGRFAVMPRF